MGALLLLFCMATVYGQAQATNGAINGMLNDRSGDVIPNVPVTLANVGTTDSPQEFKAMLASD